MTRILDSLASTLTGMLLATLMLAIAAPDAFVWSAAPRPAPESTVSPAQARPEQPDTHPGAPTAGQGSRPDHTPSPAVAGSSPKSTRAPETATSLSGKATWYDSAGGAAAGPDLRAALGPGWRGERVRVCAVTCVTTVLGDWMAADRLIDLHAPLFARLAPLSRGVLTVTVAP